MSKQTKLTDAQKEVLAGCYLGSDFPESVALEYIEQTGDAALDNIEEAYNGQYSDDEEFAREMAEEVGAIPKEKMDWPLYCIDWEYAARELMHDYFEIEGYYFRVL